MSRNAPCPCNSGKKTKLCCGVTPKIVTAKPKELKHLPGLAILIPTRGKVTCETLQALPNLDGLPAIVNVVPRKGIVDARNELAKAALNLETRAPFTPALGWYALWIDDDAFWRPGTVQKLMLALQHPEVDIIAGWFGGRCEQSAPKVFKQDGTWPKPGTDCEEGDIVEIARTGFHFVMHRVSLLKELGPNPFTPEGTQERGEDLAFCERAQNAGRRIFVHTGAPVAHIDDDGFAYLPGESAMTVLNNQLQKQVIERNYGGL